MLHIEREKGRRGDTGKREGRKERESASQRRRRLILQLLTCRASFAFAMGGMGEPGGPVSPSPPPSPLSAFQSQSRHFGVSTS